MSTNEIIGSNFVYMIDMTYGLSLDGYIATGTESIVYKGIKQSKDGKIKLSCVLKFKRKSISIGSDGGNLVSINVLERFKKNDLRIFDDLQGCRSVVRIYDVIEDLGEFSMIDSHVSEGGQSTTIDKSRFFCVVEEYIDGWSLEEYCRDEYWRLTEIEEIGNNIKRRKGFHEFSAQRKREMVESYYHDYNTKIRYQDEILRFMLNLCEILKYITDTKRILHLDIKPDNIMVTKYGKEIVLIDFGRSEYIPVGQKCIQSRLSGADYNSNEKIERMFQYGTLGYAAPECYVPAINNSQNPFDDTSFVRGQMSIESDIFSFGCTFWECLNIFELYTGTSEYVKDKSSSGNYDFYRNHILNEVAYCDRDLSLTNAYYHEFLERIILKCTKRRNNGYITNENNEYYHSYEKLEDDIILAREAAPTVVKTENVKVRNAFGLVGVMFGLILVLGVICFILKLSGSYFASQKLDTIMSDYNPTKIAWLESAAIEQMNSSNNSEKKEVYNKVYSFLNKQSESFDYAEIVVLIDILANINDLDFVGNSVDEIVLKVDKKGFSNCIQYTVTNLDSAISSEGYLLASSIYNAQNRKNLVESYSVLKTYSNEVGGFEPMVKRLAQTINHDEIIEQLASELKNDDRSELSVAEVKAEIKKVLNAIVLE